MPRRAAIVVACLFFTGIPALVTAQMRPATQGPPPASPIGPVAPNAPNAPNGPAQQPPAATGAISGVVLDGATKRPVPGAMVYLGIQGRGPVSRTGSSQQITDAKGRYLFTDLPASDKFFMNATKAGYIMGHYGETEPSVTSFGGSLLKLTEGAWAENITVYIWKPGAIAGTVTDERGEPVVGAYVRLLSRITVAGTPHMAGAGLTRTDDRGRYRLGGLGPGQYIVSVPSVQTAVPAATPADTIEGVRPGAQPDPDAPARNNGALALDATHLLIVGNYPTAGAAQAYPPSFYPGAASVADATPISLGASETRDGVDVTIQPRPAVRVSGRLAGPPESLPGFLLRLLPVGLEDLGDGAEVATALAEPNGAFTFLNVPAGDYTLIASRSGLEFNTGPLRDADMPGTPGKVPGPGVSIGGLPGGPPGARVYSGHAQGDRNAFARQPLAVGTSDLNDVVVPLKRAASMRGRIAWDGTGNPPGPTLVVLEPSDGSTWLGMPSSPKRTSFDEDEQFTIDGVLAGEYTVRALGITPLQAIKSVTVRGRDVTNIPIDTTNGQDIDDVVVTFTDRLASITGTVSGDDDLPAAVIAFPVEREQWTRYGLSAARFQAGPVTNTHSYTIPNIPAGRYYLVAVPAAQGRRWQDPAFLEEAAKTAPQISVQWGETQTQDLRLVVIK